MPADVLIHELVGHAIPKMLSESDNYNDSSIDEENKVRIEIKDYKLRDYAMEHDVCEDCEY